ncbi:interleukin-34 [Rhinatrema bivittatum]|uniref:interleukin-34 n=1 Tax=Rhinatrema bivittatum TaxID=194408 RepID=UPI00112C1A28|nr:interleukin-34 [Rhinatrema bivittatum]
MKSQAKSAIKMLCSWISLFCVVSLLCTVTGILGNCETLNLLYKNLEYKNRVEYMKYNFPINYTIRVRHEEVLKVSKVTNLRQKYNVTESDLQNLWWYVSNSVVKRIQNVLPRKHPSWNYTTDLLKILEEPLNDTEDDEQPEGIVGDIISKLRCPSEEGVLKSVRPKALLDNCFKVMDMLFSAICKWS